MVTPRARTTYYNFGNLRRNYRVVRVSYFYVEELLYSTHQYEQVSDVLNMTSTSDITAGNYILI